MDRLRVLTLNIWNRQGPWETRCAAIRKGLVELAPDLIGLQEVLHLEGAPRDQAEELAEGLGYHVVFGGAWEIGGGLHFGNAVLSRFPLGEQKSWRLPGDDTEEPRSLLRVLAEAPYGIIPFFVTHLDWKLHHAARRLRQVQFVAERVLEAKGGFPAVLVGDFNAEPSSDEIRYLRGHHVVDGTSVYLTDCFAWVGTGSRETFVRRNPFAAEAHEPDRCLDYVFVSGPDRQRQGEPLVAKIVLDQPVGGAFPSDHLGIYVELGVLPQTP